MPSKKNVHEFHKQMRELVEEPKENAGPSNIIYTKQCQDCAKIFPDFLSLDTHTLLHSLAQPENVDDVSGLNQPAELKCGEMHIDAQVADEGEAVRVPPSHYNTNRSNGGTRVYTCGEPNCTLVVPCTSDSRDERHELSHYVHAPYLCDTCHFSTSQWQLHIQHQATHANMSQYKPARNDGTTVSWKTDKRLTKEFCVVEVHDVCSSQRQSRPTTSMLNAACRKYVKGRARGYVSPARCCQYRRATCDSDESDFDSPEICVDSGAPASPERHDNSGTPDSHERCSDSGKELEATILGNYPPGRLSQDCNRSHAMPKPNISSFFRKSGRLGLSPKACRAPKNKRMKRESDFESDEDDDNVDQESDNDSILESLQSCPHCPCSNPSQHHMNCHRKKGKFKCPDCNFQENNERMYQNHMQLHQQKRKTVEETVDDGEQSGSTAKEEALGVDKSEETVDDGEQSEGGSTAKEEASGVDKSEETVDDGEQSGGSTAKEEASGVDKSEETFDDGEQSGGSTAKEEASGVDKSEETIDDGEQSEGGSTAKDKTLGVDKSEETVDDGEQSEGGSTATEEASKTSVPCRPTWSSQCSVSNNLGVHKGSMHSNSSRMLYKERMRHLLDQSLQQEQAQPQAAIMIQTFGASGSQQCQSLAMAEQATTATATSATSTTTTATATTASAGPQQRQTLQQQQQ